MSDADSSEDETGLPMSRLVQHGSSHGKLTPEMTPSVTEDSVALANRIPKESLELWSRLPEVVRLDPSFAEVRREYTSVFQTAQERERMLGGEEGAQDGLQQNHGHNAKHNLDHNLDRIHIHRMKPHFYLRYIKFTLLTSCWILFTFMLLTCGEKKRMIQQIAVPSNKTRSYPLPGHPATKLLDVILEGALLSPIHANLSTHHLTVWLEMFDNGRNDSGNSHSDTKSVKNISEPWIIPLLPEELVVIDPERRQHNTFELKDFASGVLSESEISINMRTNLQTTFPVGISYDFSPIDMQDGVIYAAVVLLALYILIIFEVVHKALAAMLASTTAVGILAGLNQRPTTEELISWIDIETLLLLFSMMVLVAIFAKTGVLDYFAVYAYKVCFWMINAFAIGGIIISHCSAPGELSSGFRKIIISPTVTKGRIWPLVTTLCFCTGFMSALIDNVTTILLMAPVTIRLWEMMELNPVPIIIAMSIYSNLGGAITPVGDPPNVIIVSNRHVIEAGVDFVTFTLHMGLGSIVTMFVVYVQWRFIFRDTLVQKSKKEQDVQELKDQLEIWRKAVAASSEALRNDCLVGNILKAKIRQLTTRIEKKSVAGSGTMVDFRANLKELQRKHPIKDKWLLAKSGFILALVILLFFLHSIPDLNLSLGWTALLGCLLLLVWADTEDLNSLLAEVEWGTLLFFAALFVFMEAVSRLGLIKWIGRQTETIILSVNEESRLAVAILLILWVSALTGAFVDNIPLTTMMVRVATDLASKDELGLPLQPLIWALAFGACFGGNGTVIGASANLVCAGLAEQHGYKITFLQFFKIGFPVLLSSTVTITVYLLICHVLFDWNG